MKTDLGQLSSRERQTLTHAALGLGDKEIAVRLGVSLTTVRTYWERLFQKFEAVNRAQAVAIFVQGRADGIPAVPDSPIETSTLMQAAIDSTIGGIIVLNPDRSIQSANEKACALLNCIGAMIEGQPIDTLIPAQYKNVHKVLDGAMVEDSENIYTVTSFVRVLGRSDMLASITLRTLDSPQGRHMVLFIQDAIAEVDARRRGRSF